MNNKLDWSIVHLPGLTTEETIRQLYNRDFMSIDDISAKLGVSPSSLKNKMRHLGIEIRPSGRRSIHRDKIVQFVQNNPKLNCHQVAKALRIPYSNVRYYKIIGEIKNSINIKDQMEELC